MFSKQKARFFDKRFLEVSFILIFAFCLYLGCFYFTVYTVKHYYTSKTVKNPCKISCLSLGTDKAMP